MASGTHITAELARGYGIANQYENESDSDFRHRVSGRLREMGHLIEAHEAYNNALYDQSDDVMTGITGALAQALQGRKYHCSSGSEQVGVDIAAGLVTKNPKPEVDVGMLLLYLELFGK